MKIIAAILVLSLCCFAQEQDRKDREASRSDLCVQTWFTGSAKLGLPFVQTLGSGLTYRLVSEGEKGSTAAAPKFDGWTIEVAYLEKRGEMEREFSEIMTPPYHQAGARDLSTRYGRTIPEMLRADHTVYFTLTAYDFANATRLLNPILWRSSPPEVQEASRELPHIPLGSAKLSIVGQQLAGAGSSQQVQSLSFKVEVTVPKNIKLTPELAARARPAACPVSPLIPLLNEMQK